MSWNILSSEPERQTLLNSFTTTCMRKSYYHFSKSRLSRTNECQSSWIEIKSCGSCKQRQRKTYKLYTCRVFLSHFASWLVCRNRAIKSWLSVSCCGPGNWQGCHERQSFALTRIQTRDPGPRPSTLSTSYHFTCTFIWLWRSRLWQKLFMHVFICVLLTSVIRLYITKTGQKCTRMQY